MPEPSSLIYSSDDYSLVDPVAAAFWSFDRLVHERLHHQVQPLVYVSDEYKRHQQHLGKYECIRSALCEFVPLTNDSSIYMHHDRAHHHYFNDESDEA